ncbi:DUF7848 domain-containing protein [Streptomyces sp. 3N207]|uniref:DUF7848 domain-containing protein n=1 Tax=Streptomyces sp. 3N207 TaxID=3457417 RepID=UPI003FD4394D
MTRRGFRGVPYVIARDESAASTYEAECVSGEGKQCGAESGPHPSPEPVEEWQRRHTQETGHRRYWRCFADHAVMEPLAGLEELAQAKRGTA